MNYQKELEKLIKNDQLCPDYVAMDIKNSPEKYGETVGIPNFDITPIEESMALLKSSGVDYEFRTTVTENFHTIDDIEKIAHWIKGVPNYFLQNFEKTKTLPYGFANTTPATGHLNATGHRLIAEALIERLQEVI